MPIEGHGRNLAVWTSGVSFVLPSKALASRASATPLHGGQRDLGLLRVSCPSSERGTNRTSGCSVWLAIHPPATIDAHRLDCAPIQPCQPAIVWRVDLRDFEPAPLLTVVWLPFGCSQTAGRHGEFRVSAVLDKACRPDEIDDLLTRVTIARWSSLRFSESRDVPLIGRAIRRAIPLDSESA